MRARVKIQFLPKIHFSAFFPTIFSTAKNVTFGFFSPFSPRFGAAGDRKSHEKRIPEKRDFSPNFAKSLLAHRILSLLELRHQLIAAVFQQ